MSPGLRLLCWETEDRQGCTGAVNAWTDKVVMETKNLHLMTVRPCLKRIARGPNSSTGQSKWDFWCTKWKWNRFRSVLRLSPVNIFPQMLHMHSNIIRMMNKLLVRRPVLQTHNLNPSQEESNKASGLEINSDKLHMQSCLFTRLKDKIVYIGS
jgi:hypothetical protein